MEKRSFYLLSLALIMAIMTPSFVSFFDMDICKVSLEIEKEEDKSSEDKKELELKEFLINGQFTYSIQNHTMLYCNYFNQNNLLKLHYPEVISPPPKL